MTAVDRSRCNTRHEALVVGKLYQGGQKAKNAAPTLRVVNLLRLGACVIAISDYGNTLHLPLAPVAGDICRHCIGHVQGGHGALIKAGSRPSSVSPSSRRLEALRDGESDLPMLRGPALQSSASCCHLSHRQVSALRVDQAGKCSVLACVGGLHLSLAS
jgi:hypothetical protein